MDKTTLSCPMANSLCYHDSNINDSGSAIGLHDDIDSLPTLSEINAEYLRTGCERTTIEWLESIL